MEIRQTSFCQGFSLIEMIVAITVLGILSASIAVFLRGPITSYFDAERRANLADAGELAMAKLSQDVSRAVPNSVRVVPVSPTEFYLEFLPTIQGGEGRYRALPPGNPLSFGIPDTGFDALMCATPTGVCPAGGDWVVVNNHLPVESVWTGTSRAQFINLAGNTITHAVHIFALPIPVTAAPDHRFQIAGQPVSYVCRGGELRRYSGYAIQAAQPVNATGAPLAGAQNDLLANGLTACSAAAFPGNLRGAQWVALSLNFDGAGDRLNLYQTIRVEPLP